MENLHVQSRALRKYRDELRQAIGSSRVSISFKLYREGLIPQEVREVKAAERIVSAIENRLAFDQLLWDKLIKVLRECEFHVLADNLQAQLHEELRSENIPTRGLSAGKFSYLIIRCMI